MNSSSIDDLKHSLAYDYKHRLSIFKNATIEEQADVILRLNKNIQREIIQGIDDVLLIKILDILSPDDTTDLLQLLDKKRQIIIVEQLNESIKKDVSTLLNFDPESAAGLMNLDFIQVNASDTIGDVSKAVQKHEARTGKDPEILVIKDKNLIGQIPDHKLALADKSEKVEKYIRKIVSIKYNVKHREVISQFRNNPHSKVAVVGDANQILGIIYTDDILKLLQKNEAASLYSFAGLSNEESIYDSIQRKVNFRYKWLIINLGTAFLAAFVVSLFNEVIAKNILLAVYMPIVAGMGGNAGTQTLAVMVRGLSQNKLKFGDIFSVVGKEASAGIINGIINGIIIFLIVLFVNHNLGVAIVLGLAMISNLFIAGFFGTLVPILMKKLGRDPASSATIFITTATDVFGFMVFLGLANLIL